LAKYELAEILICREQDRVQIAALLKDFLIVETWREFRNKPNIVPNGAKPVDNLLVDASVRKDFHPAIFSAG
jgi:hypothetical protein